jgi:hypothetical protein
VTAFDPPTERLAFEPRLDGEATFDDVWPAPLPVVVAALTSQGSFAQLLDHLPDVQVVVTR